MARNCGFECFCRLAHLCTRIVVLIVNVRLRYVPLGGGVCGGKLLERYKRVVFQHVSEEHQSRPEQRTTASARSPWMRKGLANTTRSLIDCFFFLSSCFSYSVNLANLYEYSLIAGIRLRANSDIYLIV